MTRLRLFSGLTVAVAVTFMALGAGNVKTYAAETETVTVENGWSADGMYWYENGVYCREQRAEEKKSTTRNQAHGIGWMPYRAERKQ